MGSFDYTCGISKLPIHAGTPVRYMLLGQNPYYNDRAHQVCDITGMWFPVTFPIRAKYDDYGGIEDVCTGQMTGLWMRMQTTALTKSYITLEELISAVQNGDDVCAAVPKRAKTSRVSPFMVREDVWQALLQFKWGDTTPSIEANRKTVQEWYEQCLKLVREHYEPVGVSRMRWVLHGRWELMRQFLDASSGLGFIMDNNLVITTGWFETWMNLIHDAAPVDSISEILDSIAETCYIAAVMTATRQIWFPSNSFGEQFGDCSVHSRFHDVLADVAEAAAVKDQADDEEMEDVEY